MPEDKQPAGDDSAPELNEEDLDQITGGFTPVPIPEGQKIKLRGDLNQVNLIKSNPNIIIKGEGPLGSH